MSEDRSEDSLDKVKKGLKKTAEGVKEGVEDTAEGVKEGVEDTAEGVKEGVEDTAEGVKEGVEDTVGEITDKDTYTYTKSYAQTDNREYNKAGGNDKAENIIKKTEENLRQTKEDLQQKAAKISDERKSSELVKKTGAGARTILRKPIVVILIIAAIVLVVVLLYTPIHMSNQSNEIENFNALWNQSLADLRSGNTTAGEYCINRVHDEDFCNRLKSLEYMN